MTLPGGLPIVPLVDEAAAAVDVVLFTGQSRTVGGPDYTGPPLLTAAAARLQYAALTTGALTDLVSGWYKTFAREYPATQFGNTVHAADDVVRHLVNVHADGGAGYLQLAKGGTSGIYEETLDTYTAAHTANPGLDFVCRAVCFLHGEADRDEDRAVYRDYLLEWLADFQADLRAVDGVDGSIPPVLGFFDQMNKRFLASSVAGSTLGQLDAHRANAQLFCVGATYPLPFADDPAETPPDGFDLHPTNLGSIYSGELFARAFESARTTGLWEPVAPRKITRVGRQVDVAYHVPAPPLRFSTQDVPLTTHYGFLLHDASGVVPMATPVLVGADTVRLVGDRDLVAPVRVTYGQLSTTAGNLCDSDPLVSAHDGHALPNYALHSDDLVPFFAGTRAKQKTWGTAEPVDPDDPVDPVDPDPGGTTMPALVVHGESLAANRVFSDTIRDDLGQRYSQNVVMTNIGYGGQRTEGISARQGGRPGVLKAFTLPASGGATIEFSNGVDVLGNDAQQYALACTVGDVNPVHGNLTKVDNGQPLADNWPFRFTRDQSGSARNIAAGEKLHFDTGPLYRTRGHILWHGHNNRSAQPGTGGTANMPAVPAMIKQMVDYITAPAGKPRYVVCGLIMTDPRYFTPADFADFGVLVDEVNADLAGRFGRNFLPFRDYIASKQALVDAGVITATQQPSAEDQKGIDGRYTPRSLQQVGGIHLNAAGYRVLGRRVANHVISQDWRRA